MMMKLKSLWLLIVLAPLSLTFCGKGSDAASPDAMPMVEVGARNDDHRWISFSSDKMEGVKLPQNAHKAVSLPWTESVRVASGVMTMLPYSEGKADAFFLVNRLGVVSFKDGVETLNKDVMLFSYNTAYYMFCDGGVPFFCFYKDRAFNSQSDPLSHRPFMLRFFPERALSLPLISYDDIGLSDGCEVTGVASDGADLLLCVKEYLSERSQFSYYRLKPLMELPLVSKTLAQKSVLVQECTQDEFRLAARPKSIRLAPPRLQELLSTIPEDFAYLIDAKTASLNSSILYESPFQGDKAVDAHALISPTIACVVFADGTTYLKGALPGGRVIADGALKALRLPLLPKGYVYGDVVISGGKLVVAWEETAFYQTARSGLLIVDLNKVFNLD